MQYWDVVTASFRIPWRHRYLWLLALFAGEGGGGASFNYSTRGSFPGSGSGAPPDFSTLAQQVGTWVHDHIGLIVALFIVWLVIVIALFVLAAVCEGAVVRAAAEHDAARPFDLGRAWRSGVNRFGSMIRFRLLILLLRLPAVIIVGGLVAGTVIAVLDKAPVVAVVLGIFGAIAILAAVVYSIYLSFLELFGARALILEQIQARAALVRAHRLFRKRLGRSLIVWLISIAVAIVVGLAFALSVGLVALPAIGLAIAAVASKVALLWVLFAVYVVLLAAVAIVAAAYVAGQSSTYWTLAFRRLDLDPIQPAAPAA